MAKESRSVLRKRRHIRVRRRVHGTAERPRLNIFRSLSHIYAQVIDDEKGVTLAAASTLEKSASGSLKSTGNCEAGTYLGKLIAERAKEQGVEAVVFDRSTTLGLVRLRVKKAVEELNVIIEGLYDKLQYRNEEYDPFDEEFSEGVEQEIDNLFVD